MKFNMNFKIYLIIIFLVCSSCSNLFMPAAKKDTDKALLYQAKKLIDEQDYNGAIAQLNQISKTFAEDNKVRMTFASAYAGACGMEFINFFGSIKGGVSGAFFKLFMNIFTNRAADPSYCILAEKKIKEIGADASTRELVTGEREANFFMAILAMAKLGSLLRTKADLDNDGVKDSTFDICTNSTSTGFTSVEMDEVVTGFGLFVENLPYLLGSDSTANLTGPLQTVCPTCIITDMSSVTDATTLQTVRTVFRKLLNSKSSGIGDCTDNPFITCCATVVD